MRERGVRIAGGRYRLDSKRAAENRKLPKEERESYKDLLMKKFDREMPLPDRKEEHDAEAHRRDQEPRSQAPDEG